MSNHHELDNLDQVFDFPNGEIIKKSILSSGTRIRDSFKEVFSGYRLSVSDVLNEVIRVNDYDGYVIVRDISFYTYCEHHFSPFFGTADIIYEPNEIITGLGKLVRLVKDVHARRMQIQEIMTRDIATDIYSTLDAKGVGVRTKAKHMCICSRGPSDDNSWSESIYSLGSVNYSLIVSLLHH